MIVPSPTTTTNISTAMPAATPTSAGALAQAFYSIHRSGTAVLIGVSPTGTRLSIDPSMLLGERILTGTSFDSTRQRVVLPMIGGMFMDGRCKLREHQVAKWSSRI